MLFGGTRRGLRIGSNQSINKSGVVYGLSNREIVYLAWDVTKGKVSDYVVELLTEDPQLTWLDGRPPTNMGKTGGTNHTGVRRQGEVN